jgi:hypothetical protein
MTGTLRFVFAFGCMTFALGWAVTSCGGDDEAAIAHFAEECDGECADGLLCINRICTAMCTASSAASTCGALDSRATACSGGYCYLSCQSQFNCPTDLVCTMSGEPQGTCRVQ